MQKFDIVILKRNINDLLRNNDTTQQQLADAIGMSQSNVSKALNERDKKCFTVEQIFAIADYFSVSIDWLLGYETAQKKAVGPRAVAAFVAQLLENRTLKSAPITIEEEVYSVIYNSHGFPDSANEKKSITYNALYFPSYWYPADFTNNDQEMEELAQEMFQCGNESKGLPINTFLGKFLSILSLYKKDELSEEAYQIVLKDYLGQLREM